MTGLTRRLLMASAAVAIMAAPNLASSQDGNVEVTYVLYDTIDVFGDPVMNVNYAEQMVTKAMFEPLIWDFDARTQSSELRPALATDWELIDDLRWRFYLREGVTFHNGAPFNAEAVKFSIERVHAPDFPSGDKFLGVPISHVEIIDDYTVDIVTNEPVPVLPSTLTRNGAFILEPGHYSELSIEEARSNPVGTGPYKLAEYRPDDRMILERHDDYWGWPDKANIDRLITRQIPEESTALAELLDGRADIVRIRPDMVETVQEADGVDTIIAPSLVRGMLGFNLQMYPKMEDPRVRRALNYAIDRDSMIDALAFGEHDLKMKNVVNPPHDHPDLEPYPYDPDRARELLAEAGYPDGFTIDTIDVMMPEAFDYAEIVAQYWRMIGIDLGEVRQLDWTVVRERWAQRTLSVHAFPWSAAENTPQTDMWAVSDRRQTNSTHWLHDEFEEIYAQIMTEMDDEKRQQLNYRAQEILHEDPPWVYLYLPPITMGVRERIGGYYPDPSILLEDWASIYIEEDYLN